MHWFATGTIATGLSMPFGGGTALRTLRSAEPTRCRSNPTMAAAAASANPMPGMRSERATPRMGSHIYELLQVVREVAGAREPAGARG